MKSKNRTLTWEDYVTEDSLNVHDITLPLNKNGIAELFLSSDQHLKNPVYDQTSLPMKVIQTQLAYVEKRDFVRVLDLGDAMEMISLRPQTFLAKGRIPLMKEESEEYLRIWKNALWQLEARVHGNHEFRCVREFDKLGISGFPIVDDEILKANPNCILAETERGLFLRLHVGDQIYKGYVAHGTGCSERPDFDIRKVLNNVCSHLDFVALAHLHQNFSHDFSILEIPAKGSCPLRLSRIGIRSGSTVPYLAYAERQEKPISQLGNSLVTLESKRKEIKVKNLVKELI